MNNLEPVRDLVQYSVHDLVHHSVHNSVHDFVCYFT